MKLIGAYKNGNFKTIIFDNGTKIRQNNLDFFEADFPECIDIKITNKCDMGCKMCHEDSTINGEHGKIDMDFIDTLKPFTETALGGGNPLSHPELIPFLEKLKSKKVIANMTVNQTHFMQNISFIKKLMDDKLIHGLGVSLVSPELEFINIIKTMPNVVIHVIAGVLTKEQIDKLSNNNLKMLILGYKQIRRGKDFYSPAIQKNIDWLKDNLASYLDKFNVVSFDNLAIKQLEVKRLLSKEDWDEFYMGDDGQFTMYIDLVKQEYALSSISSERHSILPNIIDMFTVVKNKK